MAFMQGCELPGLINEKAESEKEDGNGPPDEEIRYWEYLYASYSIIGTVIASDERPIPGIRITLADYDSVYYEPAHTDEEGVFTFDFNSNIFPPEWILIAEDIDGEEHGMFHETHTVVEIHPDSLEGGDGENFIGYGGEFVDIVMEPVE
jgi:putative lipoprotein (rSAM/lipoprotein system)